MNKNAVYLAVFAVLCVLAGVFVGAGIAKRQMPPPLGPGGADRPEEILITKLGLNREQAEKVTQIIERTKHEVDDIGKDVRGAIAQIKEKADRAIMDILTPQQQEKFKALQKEFERRRGPGPMEGHRPPPPPYPAQGADELPPPESP